VDWRTTININGGRETKQDELQEWAIKHQPDIILLQELKCDKTQGRYVTIPNFNGFQNCLGSPHQRLGR
jgi:exonuclease III